MSNIDIISLVTPPRKRSGNAQPSPLVTRWLERNATRWERLWTALLKGKGIPVTCRKFQQGEVDITQELPTDLVTYFVYQLDDCITPEIHRILYEGRTHVVLILSEQAVPIGHNFTILPLKTKRMEGTDILLPLEQTPSYGYGPVLQIHELQNYTEKNMQKMLRQILTQKEYFGN